MGDDARLRELLDRLVDKGIVTDDDLRRLRRTIKGPPTPPVLWLVVAALVGALVMWLIF